MQTHIHSKYKIESGKLIPDCESYIINAIHAEHRNKVISNIRMYLFAHKSKLRRRAAYNANVRCVQTVRD